MGGGGGRGGGGGGGRERAKSTPVDTREKAIRDSAPKPAPKPAPAPSRPAPAPSRPAPSKPTPVDAREKAIATPRPAPAPKPAPKPTPAPKPAPKPAPAPTPAPKPAPTPAMSRPTAVAKPSPAPAPTPAMSRPTAVAKPSPKPAPAVDARETAIAKAAGAKPSTGQMQFGGAGKPFTPVTTGTTVVTKPAQQITAGKVVKTFEDVRTTGERMAAGQTGLREGTTFAFDEKGKIVGKVVEKPALVPPALAVIRALTGQTDTMYQKTYTGKTSEPVTVGFRSERMAGDIGTTAGAPTAAAIEKQKVQETMRGDAEPAVTPAVTPEVTPEEVPEETVLGAAATTARERRRTRGKRAGQAGTILEGYGALYK